MVLSMSKLFSLQKDHSKRASARELLLHPFISKYSANDEELINWLKTYSEFVEGVQQKNMSIQYDSAMLGLDGLLGLK